MRTTKLHPELIGPLLLVGLMVVLQTLPDTWQGLLRYERSAVNGGEIWRLLTANFIHLGWAHLALNAAALLVMVSLFTGERPPLGWGVDLVICGVVCSTGLYLFSPEVHWVVGLSGALHGLFLVGACCWIAAGSRVGWVLAIGVCAKVAGEQAFGEMPFSGEIVGGAVVTDAHLWGLIGGVITVGADFLWRRLKARL